MLKHIRRWKATHILQKSRILAPLSSLIFTQPSVSAAKLDDESTVFPNPRNAVSEVIAGLRMFGLGNCVGDHRFKTIIPTLNQPQVDLIIESLSTENPESAFGFFNLLRNEYAFRHSRVSEFIVAHVLAGRRLFKELRLFVKQMVDEEGPGSAHSLCELLLHRFRDWDSSGVVWDMLAFAYSRSEMIHDALSVLARMKDLNLNVSTPTYNCLLHNLRHTDIMWSVYDEIKDSGTHQSDHTFAILIDGLCEQSGLQDAVSFFMGVENTELAFSCFIQYHHV